MADIPPAANGDAEEGASGALPEAAVTAVSEALEELRHDDVKEYVDVLHHAEVADLIERLSGEKRDALMEVVGDGLAPQVFAELDETVLESVVDKLGTDQMAQLVADMETDDAVYVVEDLDEEVQKKLLEALPDADRSLIEEGLSYPEDSAGRLMQRQVVAVPSHWTVGQAIDYLREAKDLPNDFFDLFLVSPSHKPQGSVPLSRAMRSPRHVALNAIMSAEMKIVPVSMDQEDVAYLFQQRDLVSAPVVDDAGRLVGVITVDDVVDVIHEEHEEDMMRMAGIVDDDLYGSIFSTVKTRFGWLLVNLFTAILASAVIGLFDATIEQMVALAVLMPIVASMGGNAGTQAMTVAVRAIATRDLTTTNALRVIGKEMVVGAYNGLLFAALMGLVAWLWFGSIGLGAVIGTAMIFNLVIAGLAGSAIPVLLERLKIDPAVSSAVFLTTITDVVGFVVFLGLAAALLL